MDSGSLGSEISFVLVGFTDKELEKARAGCAAEDTVHSMELSAFLKNAPQPNLGQSMVVVVALDDLRSIPEGSIPIDSIRGHSIPEHVISRHLVQSEFVSVAMCNGVGSASQIEALQHGFDDAVKIPVDFKLLRARMMARLRLKPTDQKKEIVPDATISYPIVADVKRMVLEIDGKRIEATPLEIRLMSYLVAHAGECCTRDSIMDSVWGINFETGTNTVDVYIFFLRRKLKTAGYPNLIHTVRGVGYRFG